MRHNWIRSLLCAVPVGAASLFTTDIASALDIDSRDYFGDQPIRMVLGRFDDGHWVSIEVKNAAGQFECVNWWQQVGDDTLWDELSLHGGNGNDVITSLYFNMMVCGYQGYPVNYGGYPVLSHGWGGNDTVSGGWIPSGDSGNDRVNLAAIAGSFGYGGNGNDIVKSYVSGSSNLYGGFGDDCLENPLGTAAAMSCQDGYDDRVASRGSGWYDSSCERVVSTCW